MLLGSIEISDFLDLIVEKENLDLFLDAVLAHLLGPNVPDWQCLDFYNILQDSPTLPALEAAAEKHGLRFRQEVYLPSPNISLPNDFDEYLETLDSKYRREMRRKMRNAAGFFLPVNWYAVEDEGALDEEMGNFADLMRNESEKDAFLTPEMVVQMKAIAKAFFKMGALQLAFLKVGNDYATGVFNIDYGNRIWVYNSGMAEKHASLSPGVVLMGHLLMDAIEKGRTDFDLMRGGEDYKYQMGGVDRFVMRATVDR
jgi:CelD/BcsL family acetyltransferase involved in cellulose biosynthesis